MADVADLRVKYSADTSDFDRGADRVNKGISGFVKTAGAFAAGDLLAGGIRAIGSAALGAGGALAGMAMDAADLDSKISGIVALAGGGAEDFDQLSEAINGLAINPQLIVDSTQAATVIENLIAGGLTLKDVYGGAAEATVLLANATGGSFETAGTVAVDTMAIFGIEAENMMAAVDGISRVTNASKFDIEDYAYALSQGGAQSASAGVEFDDFNAILVASASNFSGGSDAGTGIRNMFQKLIPTTVDAAEAMYDAGLMSTDYVAAAERLGDILGYEVEPNQYAVVDAFTAMSKAQGVNVSDTKKLTKAWNGFKDDFEVSAFYDMEGNLKSAAEIAGAFNTAFKDMNEQDKATAINEMFGPDAARAVLAMADYSEVAFQTLIDGMNGTASASENARTRTNNLRGDMDVFGGTLDALKLKIGKEFQPALRTLFQSGTGLLTNLEPAITGIADALANGLERATPAIVTAVEGMVGAASVVAQEGFGALFTVFEDGSSYIGGFAEALGASEEKVLAIGQAFYDLKAAGGLSELFTVFEDGSSYIGGFATALGASEGKVKAIGLALYNLKEAGLSEIFTVFEDGSSNIGGLAIALGANEDAVNSFGQSIYNLKDAFAKGGFKGLFDEAFKNVDIGASLAGLQTKLSEAFASFDLSATVTKLQEKLSTAFETFGQSGVGINLDGLKTSLTEAFNNFDFDTTIQTAKGQVNGLRDGIITNITETISGINWSGMSVSFSGMIDAVKGKVNEIDWSSISWVDVGMKLVGMAAPGLSLAIKGAQWVMGSGSFSGLVESVKNALSQIQWGDIGASFGTLATAISTGISKIDVSGTAAAFEELRRGMSLSFETAGMSKQFSEIEAGVSGIGAAFGRVSAQLKAAGEIVQSSGYFDRLSDSVRQLDEAGVGAFTRPNAAMAKFFADAVAGFYDLEKYGKGWGTTFNEVMTFDFNTVDKAFYDYLARVQAGFDNLKTEIGFGETTPAWLTSLQGWAWPALTDLMAWKWPAYLAFTWPAYLTWSWPTLPTWAWPAYLTFTWPSFPTFTWPSIPQPSWLAGMLSWNPSTAISNAASSAASQISNAFSTSFDSPDYTSTGSIPGNASGTNNWRGGPTWVGEEGPELITASRGSQIFSNRDSMAMLAGSGSGAGGGQTNNFYITSNDPESVARQVARILQQRG